MRGSPRKFHNVDVCETCLPNDEAWTVPCVRRAGQSSAWGCCAARTSVAQRRTGWGHDDAVVLMGLVLAIAVDGRGTRGYLAPGGLMRLEVGDRSGGDDGCNVAGTRSSFGRPIWDWHLVAGLSRPQRRR